MAFRLAVLILIAAGLANGLPVSAAPAPKPVVTNKTRFRIPFRFDAAALQRMNARELRLYASQDGGANWELAQTISAESGKFEFQAPGDGEYRFSVKTLDGRNQLHPPGDTFETGLVVIVDTVAPVLDLEVRAAAAGKVELRWTASDDHLDVTTLRIEYTQPGVEDWQLVSIVPRNSGQTSWSVPQGGMVAVRASVADQAGNPGNVERQANIAAGGNGNAAPSKPDFRQPVAANPTIVAETSPITDRFTEVQHPFAAPVIQEQQAPQITPKAASAQQPPIIERPPVAITHRTQFTAEQPQSRPDITQDRWAEAPDAATPATQAPTGRQRIVNTKKFQIGYQVDDVGPSGLGGVEMFITQDAGRKWWKYGDDPDQQSPFDVEVPEDGIYGFAIRARSGVGLSDEAPTGGETPAIVVIVDHTPPTLELMPVRQGTGPQANQLQLRWKIGEAHPSDKPVALYYAGNPNGPWETISTWRADTGEFVWMVPAGVPSQVYFRIIARDAAGNATQQQTDRPVIVDLAKPSAKILDVASPVMNAPQ